MFSINIYTLKQIRLSQHRYDLDLLIATPAVCHHILDLLLDLKREPVEKFGIISLNAKHKFHGLHILGQGSLDSVTIEPREVFKAAMINNAYAIIAFHLVDHLIFGEEKWFSMKEGEMMQ